MPDPFSMTEEEIADVPLRFDNLHAHVGYLLQLKWQEARILELEKAIAQLSGAPLEIPLDEQG